MFLEGQKHGRLTVVRYDLETGKYICRCDCGNKKKLRGGDIKKGRIRSCGCLKEETHSFDLIGKKINMLMVLQHTGRDHQGHQTFLCKCECGAKKIFKGKELNKDKVKSCGNHRKELVAQINSTHCESKTRLYGIYKSMIQRCNNPNNNSYDAYGGRGILVCEEWQGSEGYANFRNWSLYNGYNDTLSIDRIDVNGNYSPSNCRWATHEEQQRNKRDTVYYEFKGKSLTLPEWADIFNLNYNSLHKRIHIYKFTVEKALTYKPERIKR